MRKEVGVYLFIGLLAVAIFFTVYYLNLGPTGFAISEQESDFSGGTHSGTVLNSEGEIFLDEGETSGTYTSEVFDAGESTSWNKLIVDESVPDSTQISVENESGWINSTGYVLSGFDSSWSDLALTALYNKTSNSSIALGNATLDTSLGKVTNATPTQWNSALISYEYTTTLNASISYQVRVSDNINFTNSSFEDVEDLSNLGLEGRYFQFLVTLETEDAEMSPSLASATVNYGEEDCSDDLDLCEDEASCEDEGGYWYDDQCNSDPEEVEQEEESSSGAAPIQPTQSTRADFSHTDISALSLNAGSSQDVTWTVTNTGNAPAVGCMPAADAGSEAWVSYSGDSVDMLEGTSNDFTFTVSAPEGASGEQSLGVHIECLGGVVSSSRIFSATASGASPAETTSAPEQTAGGGGTGTGAAIFGGIGTGGVILLVVVVLALGAALFVARGMRKRGKTLKDLFSKFRKPSQ